MFAETVRRTDQSRVCFLSSTKHNFFPRVPCQKLTDSRGSFHKVQRRHLRSASLPSCCFNREAGKSRLDAAPLEAFGHTRHKVTGLCLRRRQSQATVLESLCQVPSCCQWISMLPSKHVPPTRGGCNEKFPQIPLPRDRFLRRLEKIPFTAAGAQKDFAGFESCVIMIFFEIVAL